VSAGLQTGTAGLRAAPHASPKPESILTREAGEHDRDDRHNQEDAAEDRDLDLDVLPPQLLLELPSLQEAQRRGSVSEPLRAETLVRQP
jgi:hypothetical protein